MALIRNFRLPVGVGISADYIETFGIIQSTNPFEGAIVSRGGVGIGNSVSIAGRLQLFNDANYTAFQSSASGNTVYFLPASTPATGTSVLQSTSAGVLSWVPMVATGTGAASGFTTLNTLTSGIQFFTTGTSGSGFNISSSGSTHTFNIPIAGSGTTGLISTQSQTIAGAKVFSSDLSITSPTASTNSTSGALVVTGGVGIGDSLFVAGNISVNTGTNGLLFRKLVAGNYGAIYSTNLTPSATNYTMITDGASVNFNGTNGVYFNINNTNKIQVTANNINIVPTADSTSTSTGALTVAGGVGIGGSLYVASATAISGVSINAGIITGNLTGTATTATNINVVNASTNSAHPLHFSPNATGSGLATSSNTTLSYNPSTLVLSTSGLAITAGTASTNSTTGALVVTGGVGIGGSLFVAGDLTINGTTTTINSVTLTVDDKNIELGSVTSPSDVTAEGGGITLKGATDKSINWYTGTGWSSSESWNLVSGNTYKINNTIVLSSSSIGTGITNSSLTALGTIKTGVWAGTLITALYGGTGFNSYTKGDLLVGAGTTLIKHAVGSQNQILIADLFSGSGLSWATFANPTYGSFYSTSTQQVSGAGVSTPINFNATYESNRVSIIGGAGTSSRIQIQDAGPYSLTFSAQINLVTGNTDQNGDFWFRVNGQDVPQSNSSMSVAGKDFETLITVNFVYTFANNDYFEIYMASDDTQFSIEYQSGLTNPPRPNTPSIILSVLPITHIVGASGSGISGILSLNGSTASQQYFLTGTSGTGFNVSTASGNHTFNIPIAGSGATGLVTGIAQTFEGSKTFSANTIISSSTASTTTTTGALISTGGVGIGGSVSVGGRLQMFNGANYTAFVSSASGNTVYTLPATSPATGSSVLQSTSAGVLSWVAMSSGSATPAGTTDGVVQFKSGSSLGGTTSLFFNPLTLGLRVSGFPGGEIPTSTDAALKLEATVGSFNGSVNGTYYAANAPTGFAGDLMNLQINAVSKFRIDNTGAIIQNIGTNATNTTSGSVQIKGGVGITGAVFVGESINATSTTTSTSTTSGSLIVSGGAGFAGTINVGGAQKIFSSTASTNTWTGALTVGGGVGISGQLTFAQASLGYTGITSNPSMSFIGNTSSSPITLTVLTDNSLNWEGSQGSVFSIDSNLSTGEIFSVSDISGLPIISASAGQTVNINEFGGYTQIGNGTISSSSTSTGSLVIAGGLGITGNANIGGTVKITNTTATTSSSSGAFTVTGGAGIAQSLFVGGNIVLSNNIYSGGNTFTKSGQSAGDIIFDNNSNDTAGVLYYYKNNTNFGLDVYAVGVGSTRFRIVKDLNESGGSELWSIDRNGVVTRTGWAAGETINTRMYNYSDLNMAATTTISATTYTTFATITYTPLSSTSYLWIEFSCTYNIAGAAADDFWSNIEVAGSEIVNAQQVWTNGAGGGTRSGVMFPLAARYTNSGTAGIAISVRSKRGTSDDNATIYGNTSSGFMRIQEIGR